MSAHGVLDPSARLKVDETKDRKAGGAEKERETTAIVGLPGRKTAPKVLLLGYNGANNTGSEARLLSIVEDVRAVVGSEALVTVPTLNQTNLRRYLTEEPKLRIAPMPSIYFLTLWNLVRKHDLVMLVEGSCYMDTWTSALLWAFLWATRCARSMGKPVLAYAVDTGKVSPFNERLVRSEASKTNLIVTRNRPAAERLREWGVSAPIEITGDCAFTFEPEASDGNTLAREWPEATSGVVGLSVVDFNLWPVVFRPWGRRDKCYRWPYYFSQSKERTRKMLELAAGYAALADHISQEHGKSIALICMEELDEPLAREIRRLMAHPERARVFSARDYNASQMTSVLRSLDLLVTSRYHASVLSIEAGIPQVAVGHDTRLDSLYRELGIYDECFIRHDHPGLWCMLRAQVDRLLAEPESVKAALQRGFEDNLSRAKRNRRLLKRFVEDHGWTTAG